MSTATITIADQITELKAGRTLAQLKAEDFKTYMKVSSLSAKLSEEKAINNGNFITKAHLVEYKNLIVWILKNKCQFRGYMNLAEAMTTMLQEVEAGKVVFKTEKGIKGVICRLALNVGLDNAETNLRNDYNFGTPMTAAFQQFRINALLGK